MLCGVDGCNSPLLAKGLCKRHYDRQRRHGDPLVCKKTMVARGEPLRWMKEHVLHEGNGCLTWPFARFPDGRAHMRAGKPSRIMCELARGPAPSPKHEAAHSCGKGHQACVNPQHLRWATPAENAADKDVHGTLLHGEAHYAAKLTVDDVRTIRSLEGTMTQQSIADRFGVRLTCVNRILRRQAWKRVA